MRRWLLACLAACTACADEGPATDVQILWDRWGVPHVYGESQASLFRGFGWAQAHSHGDVLLRLIGQARGRAAELWGEAFLDSDRWVWTMNIPDRSQEWYGQQPPEFAWALDSFAEGINAYVRAHPERIATEVQAVLPVRGVDLLAHLQRVVHFSFVSDESFVTGAENALEQGGSNAWAIAPDRSDDGHALLLANPHLPWSDRFLLYEAHLECPGYRAYGTTIVGFPTLAIAFNDQLGWTHTVNTHDGADLFELELEGDGYRWGDGRLDFETRVHKLRFRRPNGDFGEEALTVLDSVHGPVIAQDARHAMALRVVGLDRSDSFGQWWDMGRARSLEEFESALRKMQLATFTVLYADAEGNILHLFGGLTPRRADESADWSRPVPGKPETLWNAYHEYDELPRVLNPPSGWLQNANDPPWTTTLPRALNPESYPDYLAPRGMSFRAQRSAQMLIERESVSLDELVADKHSTHVELADRILDDLIEAARASESELVQRAAQVLEDWDRSTDAASSGAVLFLLTVQSLGDSNDVFAQPWDEARPTQTPTGLASPPVLLSALERGAERAIETFGALDIPWGDVFRLRAGKLDLPCSGGAGQLGIFRAFDFAPDPDGRMRVIGGDSFVAAIEFSDPVRARVLMTYGNSSQTRSPHLGDQIPLAARQELRTAWFTRTEIEAELERREWVPGSVMPRPDSTLRVEDR